MRRSSDSEQRTLRRLGQILPRVPDRLTGIPEKLDEVFLCAFFANSLDACMDRFIDRAEMPLSG